MQAESCAHVYCTRIIITGYQLPAYDVLHTFGRQYMVDVGHYAREMSESMLIYLQMSQAFNILLW